MTRGFLKWCGIVGSTAAISALCARYAVDVRAQPASRAQPPASVTEPADSEEQSRDHRDTAEMMLLKARLSSLEERAAGAEIKKTPAPEQQPAEIDPRDNAADRAEADRRRREYMDTVAQSFRAEPTNRKWASETASALRDAFDDKSWTGGPAREVDCRTDTCRVEIEDDGSASLGESMRSFTRRIAPILPNVSADHVPDATGHMKTILYLSRPN